MRVVRIVVLYEYAGHPEDNIAWSRKLVHFPSGLDLVLVEGYCSTAVLYLVPGNYRIELGQA